MNETKQQKSKDGFYARRPIEETKVFKSKDGKSIVVQIIKTCVFPVNYISTIVKNKSPFAIAIAESQIEVAEC